MELVLERPAYISYYSWTCLMLNRYYQSFEIVSQYIIGI